MVIVACLSSLMHNFFLLQAYKSQLLSKRNYKMQICITEKKFSGSIHAPEFGSFNDASCILDYKSFQS